MPDYRALAQALDPYAIDTGTPDAIKMFQSGYKLPNFLGMTASQPTPQEIERMVAEQSPAFGVFPQMKPYRSQQDITASANVPVDLLRGRVAGTRGLFGDVVNQPIPMVRPLQLLSQAVTGQQKYPDTEHYLETMPLKSNTPIGDVAGRIGSFAPINPMPAVRAGQKGLNLLGMEVADRLATGRSVLPSLLKEPQTAMFAVEPNPSMAMADESSAMRQQLTDKMQALLAQKKMATSAVDVGSINQQIGELQAQFKSLPAMGRVAREVVVPEITAPVSNLGFYSATEQAAINLERSKGTGQSFLNDLMNAPDVKNYEIEAMGLDTYLKGKTNVTRQEVQDFIANNRVDVQEVRYGALTPEDQAQKDLLLNRNRQLTDQIATAKLRYEEGGIQYSELRKTISDISKERTGIEESLSAFQGEAPKFGQYQLPGGENYRELLLTLPNKPMDAGMAAENYYTQFVKRGGEADWSQLTPEKQQIVINSMSPQARNASAAPEYRSSHFNEPNILAHMRVNDRVDAEGKKMLLIEEVQSDWHQAGREKGYQNKSGQYGEKVSPEEYKRGVALQNQQRNQPGPLTPSEQAELNDIMGRHEASIAGARVPDAPFKDTWHQLALKRAIKEAVDKGYDRIGLTTGKQQAERYDLSKQVDYIDYKTSGYGDSAKYSLGIVDKNQQGIDLPKEYYSAKELPEIVGKEIAEKIIKGEGQSGGGRMTLRGVDLQVGGEGMKKYYDEVYPNYLNKLGKKYGSQVGETNVKTQTGEPAFVDYIVGPGNFNNTTVLGLRSDGTTAIINQNANSMEEAQQLANRYKEKHLGGGQEKVRYLDITPEMRKAIKEGQPLASIEEELAKALA